MRSKVNYVFNELDRATITGSTNRLSPTERTKTSNGKEQFQSHSEIAKLKQSTKHAQLEHRRQAAQELKGFLLSGQSDRPVGGTT